MYEGTCRDNGFRVQEFLGLSAKGDFRMLSFAPLHPS